MSTKKVLIVDDQPEITEIVEEFITNSYDVETNTCLNAQAALEELAKNIYDLVITDYSMPGMNGVELARSIRSTIGPNQLIPIIFLTGLEQKVKSVLGPEFKNVTVINKVDDITKISDFVQSVLEV